MCKISMSLLIQWIQCGIINVYNALLHIIAFILDFAHSSYTFNTSNNY